MGRCPLHVRIAAASGPQHVIIFESQKCQERVRIRAIKPLRNWSYRCQTFLLLCSHCDETFGGDDNFITPLKLLHDCLDLSP